MRGGRFGPPTSASLPYSLGSARRLPCRYPIFVLFSRAGTRARARTCITSDTHLSTLFSKEARGPYYFQVRAQGSVTRPRTAACYRVQHRAASGRVVGCTRVVGRRVYRVVYTHQGVPGRHTGRHTHQGVPERHTGRHIPGFGGSREPFKGYSGFWRLPGASFKDYSRVLEAPGSLLLPLFRILEAPGSLLRLKGGSGPWEAYTPGRGPASEPALLVQQHSL